MELGVPHNMISDLLLFSCWKLWDIQHLISSVRLMRETGIISRCYWYIQLSVIGWVIFCWPFTSSYIIKWMIPYNTLFCVPLLPPLWPGVIMERPASDHSGTQWDRKEVQKSTRHTCEISVYACVCLHKSLNTFHILNLESLCFSS